MPHLSWNEVRDRAIRFSREHAGDRSESAEKQTFWNDFFNVFGLRRASLASFEANVTNLKGNKGAIDLLWRGKLLVEHKSFGEDLALAQTQAFTYIEDLTRDNRWEEIPRFVLVSDFAQFVLYDLEPEEQRDLPLFDGGKTVPHHFVLAEFSKHVRQFAFMLGQTRVRLDPEDPANEKAYGRMCELHDALKTGGFDPHDLERLLVRILFCLFAEDTSIFEPDAFTQFIRTQTRDDGSDLGARLNELFDWLNDPRADATLADTDPFYGFRYVNGRLFQSPLRFARFDRRMRDALLFCCDFQWAKISPAVFGSLFQGVMQDRARRQQGAHYTSERDIMKVLRSLFLDELRAEWERRRADRSSRRRAEMETFHEKLRSLRFLDPACGCGNFLVLAYRELRALEIEVIRALHGKEQVLDVRQLLKVDVDQFHGIEYSEWPVRIAEVALWLMDHQMNAQAAAAFGQTFDRLPLRSSPHIVQGNALRLDWNEVLPREQCSYVLGNPPFVGHAFQSAQQKVDQDLVMAAIQGSGVLDYVCNWYVRAAQFIQGTRITVGFVSTNSITQGEQAALLWNHLFQRYNIKIHFGHRTFSSASESRGRAHVHVVIIGFAAFDTPTKPIYDYDTADGVPTVSTVSNIGPYLIGGPDRAISNRTTPLSDVPKIRGEISRQMAGTLSPQERTDLLAAEPDAAPFVRRYMSGGDFINGIERDCLWLKDAAPAVLRKLPRVMARVEAVKNSRLESNAESTRAYAKHPTLFRQIAQPDSDYLAVPEVSSERREYIPRAYLSATVICSNKIQFVPEATHYLFGVLTSVMHIAWARQVGGRLKSDFSYSNTLVYNNFPWPNPTPEQRARVEEKARAVLAAREPHLPPRGMSTLADLYDPLTMPAALAKAHADLDRAVEKCYRAEPFHSDRERVEHLFHLYEQLTAPLLPATPKTRGRRSQTAASTPRPRRVRTPGLPSAGRREESR